ncbi:hypothetical protein FQN57_005258 [Myotisia sp. PD_48]|nr:hypothetical protein FQN57_005258 [Myotisia sp. PD_48]
MSSRNAGPGNHPANSAFDREYDRYKADNGPMSTMSNGYGRPRERRAGGYGGLLESNPPKEESSDHLSSQYSLRNRTRDEDGGPSWGANRDDGRLRSRERYGVDGRRRSISREPRGHSVGGGGGNQEIDGVLQLIEDEWDFMVSDNCIPVQVGLQLMDTSTLGRADKEPDFLRMNNTIQQTLRSVVNEYHQGFGGSIETYHKIRSSIHNSQTQIRGLKTTLIEAKAGLLSMKPDLKGLAVASQGYDDLLQLFGSVEHLQSLPEKLEAGISEKKFIAAVDVLLEGNRLLADPELKKIGALADLRVYFSNQETTLTDILVEELHDHLYLKSPYCRDRWKPPSEKEGTATPSSANGFVSWEKPVYKFLSNLDTSTPLVEDGSVNPESDTFYYIHVIIEALHKMGNMEIAVDRVEQRLPVELFGVVDRTGVEVDARYPKPARTLQREEPAPGAPTDLNLERGHVLSEFLWNLYSKFEAIAEGHRVMHDVIAGIIKRDTIRDHESLIVNFQELWKLYQSEMRSLLHDYLATDGAKSYRATPSATNEEAAPYSVQRDKTKKLFKLSEIDQNTPFMKTEQTALAEILRASVPGLVPKTRQIFSVKNAASSNQESSGTGHKLLIEPSVFNISLLLPPALAFIQRLKEIVPPNSDILMSTLTSFLDEFLANVFQPQLEEAVSELCTASFIAADAYTEDSQWAIHSTRPIFKGTVNFMNVIKTFSRMLDSIPHDQAFSQLIIDQIVTYYSKCSGWYKALMTRVSSTFPSGVGLKTSAALAESGEIRGTAMKLWDSSRDEKQDYINKEVELLLHATLDSLQGFDVICDPKTVASLSLLYNSVNWLISNLLKLRHITPYQANSTNSQPRQMVRTRRWTLETSMKPKRGDLEQPLRLPMTKESVVGFDSAIESLQALAFTSLLTLYLDIRCGAIYMVVRCLKGNIETRQAESLNPSIIMANTTLNSWAHIVSVQPTAASPAILELNGELISFSACMSTYLGFNECRFITSGLARLVDRTIVSGARFIEAMNNNGALRLQLDVLVLQQNLKNIMVIGPSPGATTHKPSSISEQPKDGRPTSSSSTSLQETVALPQSAKFLDWFLDGAEKALQYAKDEKDMFKEMGNNQALEAGNGDPFTYDELKVLVELCFSAVLRGPRGSASREEFIAAKRGSGDALLRLSEVMWDT